MKKTDLSKYSKEMVLKAYLDMHRVRAFDQKASDLFLAGKMSGNIHTCIGQEACAVGANYALNSDDLMTTSHRGHGQCLMKGADSKLMMAELFGKVTGYCKGKGGSMHIADLDIGIVGANGIVGAGIPLAVGSALASSIYKDGKVTLTSFGDSSTNSAPFHEALNMASAWKLPNVFLCENNKYGVSVNIDRVTNVEDLSVRAMAYGIPGVTVDGNDIFAVYEAVQEAVDRARRGDGPSLIEAKTYRHHGHYEGDPQMYKANEEVQKWMDNDPINKLEKAILEAGIATKAELEELANQAAEEMNVAAEFAENSAFPDVSEAFTEIYAMDNDWCVND